jgi:MFS family permease
VRVHERWAVSALFFANGALFASMLPRLPEIKSSLDLTDGQLGLALLGIGLGGLVGSLSTRWLLPRVGSRSASVGSTLALAAGMPLVGLAPSGWVLFCIFVAYGVSDAVTDVSMNVAGVEAQRRLGRAVLNSMHGIWSVGAVGAGLIGSAAAELTVPLALHLGTVAVVCAVLALLVARSVPNVSGEVPAERQAAGSRFSPALALLCGLAVLAALIEAAPYSWSAIYLADDTGASPGTAGLGFTAFTTAMVVGRLVADKVVDKVGPVPVVRAGGLAAGLALAVALAVGGTAAGIVAFAVMGLGSAAVFPAMITAAGAMPGQAVQAMNMATRVGFLAAPPLIGLVADSVGLPLALGLLVVPAALGLALFAGAVRLR